MVGCAPALLLLLLPAAAASSGLQVTMSAGASFVIEVDGHPWFTSGNTSVTVDSKLYSTADGSLKASGPSAKDTGSDVLGQFSRTMQKWIAGSTPYTTSVRLYTQSGKGAFAIFEQSFPSGAEGTASSSEGGGSHSPVSSCFPAIDPDPASGQPLGFVSWQGRFLEGSKGGTWGGSSRGGPGVGTGDGGGPFVVFGQPIAESLVFSAASNFMTNTIGTSPAPGDSSFCFGLDAPVTHVPAGYSLETMVFLGTGINSAMKAFGTTMLHKYGTVRPTDYTREWLGFSTDNGAYYYYGWHQTEQYPNYQTAMEGVHAYSVQEGIPYKHILLDSWWYTKGDAGGLKEWDATNQTFPDGLQAFAAQTGWKFQMHNRMWADDNVYATQNGGSYKFIVEPQEKLAIPDEQALWDDLMSNKTQHGIPLHVYEQDWMYNEWQGLNATRQSPTLSRQWLMQMGAGAAKSNVSVQYCMTFARMVMQTAEIPAVTTFRASDDYGPGQTGYYPTAKPGKPPTDGSTGCGFPYCVYYVGTTSILAYAMQLGPSKDNYWSTPLQGGSAFNRGPDPWHPSMLNATHEPYNEMQSAISSYTTAQVAPSDGIGYSNASLIKMACREDGRLLQPSAPARAIDASFALEGAPVPHVQNVHPIMTTYSEVEGAPPSMRWAHALVIGLNSSFTLTPAHFGEDLAGPTTTATATATTTATATATAGLKHVLWWGYRPSGTAGSGVHNVSVQPDFSAARPLNLERYSDFGLYHVAPVSPLSQVAYLGELGKWVPVASARTTAIHDSAAALAVSVVGVPKEKVELAFFDSRIERVFTVLCVFGASGVASASSAGKCE